MPCRDRALWHRTCPRSRASGTTLDAGEVSRSSLSRVNADKPWELYEALFGGCCRAARHRLRGVRNGTAGTMRSLLWCRHRRANCVRASSGRGQSGRMNTRYSHSELEALLADAESDLVLCKESLRGDAPRTIRQAVCAFANDLPDHRRQGVIFVGVDDSGRPTGLRVTDELLRQLADMKSDGNILPPPTLTVGKEMLRGQAVAVVTVQPSDSPPVRHRGTTWVRVGPRRAVASVQDERILNEKRRYRDPHFDAQPLPAAQLGDLLIGRFNDEYLPAAIDPQVLAANDRTIEERLAAAKMVLSAADPVPTVAGILALGRRQSQYHRNSLARGGRRRRLVR